ncbi:hypothetical protein L207DRAFT_537048 [Hyaloscypha variabilis F]|uniref:Uncharacterized protein n=1 Tax=Hyaloscypha variabilis (strain UAMH 11265 / GT02V1 / F) TaxID=1149755 RepID=A0A2J6QZ88_HYAVF|nr:hypothetical protein L207DRAFT_537048 [Hyaloscypha variabilis F]
MDRSGHLFPTDLGGTAPRMKRERSNDFFKDLILCFNRSLSLAKDLPNTFEKILWAVRMRKPQNGFNDLIKSLRRGSPINVWRGSDANYEGSSAITAESLLNELDKDVYKVLLSGEIFLEQWSGAQPEARHEELTLNMGSLLQGFAGNNALSQLSLSMQVALPHAEV